VQLTATRRTRWSAVASPVAVLVEKVTSRTRAAADDVRELYLSPLNRDVHRTAT